MLINENHVTVASTRTSLLRASCALALFSLFLIGLGYSLVATGLGQLLFPDAANGSLIRRGGTVVGSALVAQPFAADRYFHPRPSAAVYDPMAVAGSNQARTNPELRSRVSDALAAVISREHVNPDLVPGDLITQSGSGSDPDISPQSARIQIDRIARARGMTETALTGLVESQTQSAQWGLFGQSRINVLDLNLALDALEPMPQAH